MSNVPLPERKMAPVQGWPQGIPWSLHLEAYAAYCKKWSPQPALIDLEGRNCRGGFGTDELDEFIPGWRERASEIAQLRSELAHAAAVSAAKDAEIAGLRAELLKSLADNAPLRERVRVLEDALRGLMVGCKYCNIQGQWHWHEKAIASNEALDAARAALAARTGEAMP